MMTLSLSHLEDNDPFYKMVMTLINTIAQRDLNNGVLLFCIYLFFSFKIKNKKEP